MYNVYCIFLKQQTFILNQSVHNSGRPFDSNQFLKSKLNFLSHFCLIVGNKLKHAKYFQHYMGKFNNSYRITCDRLS